MKIDKIVNEEDNITIYKNEFANLTDLYNYLSKNPRINNRVFSNPSSMVKEDNFHGESLEKSIQYLLGGYTLDFNNFLKLSNELRSSGTYDYEERTLKRGMFGGQPLASLVAAGVPDCMLKYDRSEQTKYITIYYNLSYPSYTSKTQIINRGLATLYIIEALEDRGYIVDFKAFDASRCQDEYVVISINLKKPGDLFLNIEKCYYPMYAKEFLRRILFRVLESINVTNSEWGDGYGKPLRKEEIKDFFKTSKNDLIISYPNDMEILGNNIYEDTIQLIENLNIQNEFDLSKIRKK